MLYIIRGLPGSGKSTLASELSDHVFEADDFWKTREFDPKLLPIAHKECYTSVAEFLINNGNYVHCCVSNTFTTEKELKPYVDLAKEMEIPYTVIVVENRHGNKSIHNVPEETVEKMRKRFSIKL